jgi:hypothetical protein
MTKPKYFCASCGKTHSELNHKCKSFMRVDKGLLKDLAEHKITARESYADVVKRLIDKERKLRK